MVLFGLKLELVGHKFGVDWYLYYLCDAKVQEKYGTRKWQL